MIRDAVVDFDTARSFRKVIHESWVRVACKCELIIAGLILLLRNGARFALYPWGYFAILYLRMLK